MKPIHVYPSPPTSDLDAIDRITLFVIWMLAAGAIAFMFLLGGCAANPTALANQGTAASQGLAVNLDTAHSEIAAASPHCDATGKTHLTVADGQISSARTKLPAINTGLAQVAPLQAENTKLKHRFWSPRQIGLMWVFGIGTGTLLVILGICYFATPLAAPIGLIAAGFFHIFTLGVPKVLHAIVSRIQKNVIASKLKAVKSITVPAAPPTGPVYPIPQR